MATYVNDLRLKEIGTGESSGTWGTETNTNLELIGEALGFGTEAITTNADTHTTTVADGSTDPGRAMYIKYTGTLDSACTITIAPNTMSRMHFIENGTSGSQNIIISQGTGANVTIPAGDVKAVYLDGAGSGAAVADAFASLNTVDLKVEDDLTVTDDATIGGTLGVTGVLTANAGVVVDNITIDGTEIDLSSGNLTLDVAGSIKLDADGAEVAFLDGGTEIGVVSMGSQNMNIESKQADKDIIFKGIDGSSDVTALTLDMSEAGAATFNDKVVADSFETTAGGTITTASGNDLNIVYPDSRSLFIKEASTTHVTIDNTGRAILATGMLIHDTTALSNTTFDARDVDNVTSLNVQNNGAVVQRSQSVTAAPTLLFNKARGSLGSESNINTGDFTGSIVFRGYHTNGFYQTATIESKSIQASGTNDMPGSLIFSTTPDGSVTPTSKLEIADTGITTLKGGTTSGFQVLEFSNGSITVANDASVGIINPNVGMMLAISATRSQAGVTYPAALFFTTQDSTVTVVADPEGQFTNTANTANKINVYTESNTVRLQNKVGVDQAFAAALFDFKGV